MSVLDNIIEEIYNDVNSYRRNRDDVILSAMKSRLDKSLLTYKKEMQRRETLEAVRVDKLLPKQKKGRVRVE